MDTMSTGIKNADKLINYATEAGLTVDARTTVTPVQLYADGSVMIPEHTFIGVYVTVPVPEVFNYTVLGMDTKFRVVSFFYSRFEGRGPGKFVPKLAERRSLGRCIRIPNAKEARVQIDRLREELDMLTRLAEERSSTT